MNAIKVSVLIVTYNQEQYIREAVESVLMQRVSFPIEVLIGNDCSSDGTGKILDSIATEDIQNITVSIINRKENLGASLNIFDLIIRSKGEYVIILEGDDYWIRTDKLENLVRFLDNQQHFIGISHARKRMMDEKLVGVDPDERLYDKALTIKDYSEGKQFSAMATLFRNFYKDADENYYKHMFLAAKNACDLVLCYNILKHGDIFVTHEQYGVYRVASGKNYNSTNNQLASASDYLRQIEELNKHYGCREELTHIELSFQKQKSKAYLKNQGIMKWFSYLKANVPSQYRIRVSLDTAASGVKHLARRFKKDE